MMGLGQRRRGTHNHRVPFQLATGGNALDLQELSHKTRLERRKLRYCLDHDLVPGLQIQITPDEAGRPRRFADDVGFAIVCVAKLLELGLRHDPIRRFLKGLSEIQLTDGSSALAAILEHGHEPALVHFGDGVRVRLVLEKLDYDSGWRGRNRARLAEDYQPDVTVSLDIGQIRRKVFSRELPRTS